MKQHIRGLKIHHLSISSHSRTWSKNASKFWENVRVGKKYIESSRRVRIKGCANLRPMAQSATKNSDGYDNDQAHLNLTQL